jgi:polar amino acid transport system substrate-binding protein
MLRCFLGFGMVLGVQWVAPPTVLSAELTEIQARGYLIVAVKDNLRPLGFRTASGELTGFEIDIARRLAADLLGDPAAVVLKPVSNLDRINAVIDGEVDIAIADVTVTPQRQRIATFSTPYYLDGVGIITTSPTIQTLGDLRQGQIALLDRSSTVAQIRNGFPGARLVPVATYQAALELLSQDQVDAFAGDVSVLTGWAQQDSRYRLLPPVLSVEPLAIVIPKGTQYSSLRYAINQALAQWDAEGWLQDRAAHWGLP